MWGLAPASRPGREVPATEAAGLTPRPGLAFEARWPVSDIPGTRSSQPEDPCSRQAGSGVGAAAGLGDSLPPGPGPLRAGTGAAGPTEPAPGHPAGPARGRCGAGGRGPCLSGGEGLGPGVSPVSSTPRGDCWLGVCPTGHRGRAPGLRKGGPPSQGQTPKAAGRPLALLRPAGRRAWSGAQRGCRAAGAGLWWGRVPDPPG